eukprot:gene18699-biopygen2442
MCPYLRLLFPTRAFVICGPKCTYLAMGMDAPQKASDLAEVLQGPPALPGSFACRFAGLCVGHLQPVLPAMLLANLRAILHPVLQADLPAHWQGRLGTVPDLLVTANAWEVQVTKGNGKVDIRERNTSPLQVAAALLCHLIV